MKIALLISSIILFSFVIGCASDNRVTIPPNESAPPATSLPAPSLPEIVQQGEVPPLPVPGMTWVESQWVLKGRTANLYVHSDEEVRAQYAYVFDKPVAIWFREIEDEVIIIGGLTHYPPHKVEYLVGENIPSKYFDERWNPPGTPLYYYMNEITAFSYAIYPVDEQEGHLSYYLHIKPSQEGATINITVRSSGW